MEISEEESIPAALWPLAALEADLNEMHQNEMQEKRTTCAPHDGPL